MLTNILDSIPKCSRHTENCTRYADLSKMLETDDDGWVSSERDLGEVKKRHQMLFDCYVSKMGTDRSPD